MIAVWNGEGFKIYDGGKTGSEIWISAKKELNGAHIVCMPTSYWKTSRAMTEIYQAGIVAMLDEDGIRKQLPVTMRFNNFDVVGSIVFCGYDARKRDWLPLSPAQLLILDNTFAQLVAAHNEVP